MVSPEGSFPYAGTAFVHLEEGSVGPQGEAGELRLPSKHFRPTFKRLKGY